MADVYDDHTKPIPAFYCCYLLRSSVRHSSLYIGSTPHPHRRLAQHNGVSKGGARKTANDKRPWEMVVIVEGFMSRIAALQFEWAWQKPDKSRHLGLSEDDKTAHEAQVHAESARGKRKVRARRPARSLKGHLENLHALLRSTYFSSLPIRIRFFSADVYQLWRIWSDRVDGVIPLHIRVILDGSCAKDNRPGVDDTRVGSVEHIQVDYSKIQDYLEKAVFQLDDPEDLQCKLCQAPVDPKEELVVVCPQARCYCINHLLCLSARFLDSTKELEQLIPISGKCPGCHKVVQWSLMMQELSFRTRGGKELQAILRKKKRGDLGIKNAPREESDGVNTPTAESQDFPVSVGGSEEGPNEGSDESIQDDILLDDDWVESLAFESDTEIGGPLKTHSTIPSRIEIVIEDSDCDDT
ncbi:structure-specific endonuclease subunit slx1 [Aspergillus coremiiformis]|uniref:Structure-specific endonuclease subunit slx1 n=1 Tax=Aspergillus coremiiformis TaxID=138285 RepID=A0A5N6ZI34_9EURO|nr:structure-specific endonuclease subunit slx1 [Aspergillus coremiiformis]